MRSGYNRGRLLDQIACDYFTYLGSNLPQQCASDEFYFLPRAEAALQYLTDIDDLTPEKIQDHVGYVERLLSAIPSPEESDGIEKEIDSSLLKQSMKSFIREFKEAEVWRSDPTLYVKIPLFATDQVLSRRDDSSDQTKADLSKIFRQIPSFLSLAVKNLRFPSEISLQVARDMAQDALHFYTRDLRPFMVGKIGEDQELLIKYGEVLEAWERFHKDLLRVPSRKSFAIGNDDLKGIFALSLSYPKSPDEILEVAQCAYENTQDKITALARKIDSSKTWNRIIYEGLPSVSSPAEVMRLFQEEIKKLRRFFSSQDIMTFPLKEKVMVLQTPSYLQSLRATASYQAPLTGNTKAHGIFYITPGREDLELIAAHCPYLSAHETYPGHHLLDHVRIHHSNPIRRQIESPLFYEGWACYSEQLLDELRYIRHPRQQLIQLKRQLWRILRAILDVKLHTERMSLKEAAKEIESLGFSPQRAQRQARRFALTPGYQSCYFIGSYEILRLRERFSPRLDVKGFHNTLLDGGQIPFHLVEKRLQERVNENG